MDPSTQNLMKSFESDRAVENLLSSSSANQLRLDDGAGAVAHGLRQEAPRTDSQE